MVHIADLKGECTTLSVSWSLVPSPWHLAQSSSGLTSSSFLFLAACGWWQERQSFAAACFEVHQIVRDDPSLRDEQIAKPASVGNHVFAFASPGIDPDAQRQLRGQRVDFSKNHTIVPPHRGRQHGQLAERASIAQPEMKRQQSAER